MFSLIGLCLKIALTARGVQKFPSLLEFCSQEQDNETFQSFGPIGTYCEN